MCTAANSKLFNPSHAACIWLDGMVDYVIALSIYASISMCWAMHTYDAVEWIYLVNEFFFAFNHNHNLSNRQPSVIYFAPISHCVIHSAFPNKGCQHCYLNRFSVVCACHLLWLSVSNSSGALAGAKGKCWLDALIDHIIPMTRRRITVWFPTTDVPKESKDRLQDPVL